MSDITNATKERANGWCSPFGHCRHCKCSMDANFVCAICVPPSPTKDDLIRRQREWRAKMQQLLDDATAWNACHPDEEPIVIEPITAAEIEALKNG